MKNSMREDYHKYARKRRIEKEIKKKETDDLVKYFESLGFKVVQQQEKKGKG